MTTTGAVLLLALSGAPAAATVWLRRRYMIVTIRGDSMIPALHDGDTVLARRCGSTDVHVGDVVVAWAPSVPDYTTMDSQPTSGRLVKTVAAVAGDAVPDCVRQAADGVSVEVAAAVAGAAAAPQTVPPDALIVLGDNGGYDSRIFGLLNADRVIAVMVRRLGVRRR